MEQSIFNPDQVLAGCIEVYDNIIDNSKNIIDLVESKNQWRDAAIFHGEGGKETSVNKDIRSNKVFNINQFSYEVDIELYQMCRTVWQYCNEYAKKYDFAFSSTEGAQILKYSDGEYYEPHADAGGGAPTRIFSALLYLNDVENGGETEFINFDIKVKPRAGRLVIFPSNYAYAHAARPPKEEYKYVAVFWMRI